MAFHWSNSQDFHWSIFRRAKWNVLWETPKSFRVDPEVFPKKKCGKNPVRKKARKIISLTLTSLPIKSFPVISGDVRSLPVISFPVTSLLPITSPPQILVRFNMIYYWGRPEWIDLHIGYIVLVDSFRHFSHTRNMYDRKFRLYSTCPQHHHCLIIFPVLRTKKKPSK